MLPPSSFLENANAHLLSLRNSKGHWEGELASSALATATAVVALGSVDRDRFAPLISAGIGWLLEDQNEDGGWGDTPISFSNISTTLLCWGALQHSRMKGIEEADQHAKQWILKTCGSLDHNVISEAIKDRYGKDRTFSVPILMHCAVCGRLGDTGEAWRRVLPLPFELAALPQEYYAAARLPVVSYALPALIAIGYARFHHAPPPPPLRQLRKWLWPRCSQILQKIQPAGGGFLEATPLTSFVTMALANSGQGDHPVVAEGVAFLEKSIREDGSWPIDTNLSTWGTTLAIKALNGDTPDPQALKQWLLDQQYKTIHPYTNAPPGGWAWTDLPGGVPDGDDTAGALLALRKLPSTNSQETTLATQQGCLWLAKLQNRDGGIPTFCRGWGALPFDRSSPDLTAHALRAWVAWNSPENSEISKSIQKATRYLQNSQQGDGSWLPLWFGNQHREDEENPTYGTCMVAIALSETGQLPGALDQAFNWISKVQNDDGGWGGGDGTPSSIEETALALDALGRSKNADLNQLKRGIEWLTEATENGQSFPPSPIGFYFAKLWYHEKLYPVVWTVGALNTLQMIPLSSSSTAPHTKQAAHDH